MSWTSAASATTLTLFLLCVSCSGGSSDKKEVADSGSGEAADGGDDFEVAEGVPMALLGPEYLAQIDSRLGAALVSGRYADFEKRSAAGTSGPLVGEYAYATGILEAGGRMAGEMKYLLAAVQQIQARYFGPGGTFKAGEIRVPLGSKQRTFKVSPVGTPDSFVVVKLNGDGAPYRYTIEVHNARDGGIELATILDVSPVPGGERQAKVRFQHRQRDPATGAATWIQASYDTTALTITAVFGPETASSEVPAKTKVRLDIGDGTNLDVFGAYVWRREASTSGFLPRYYDLRTGDVEVFRARTRGSAGAETAQEVAFLPADVAASLGADPGPAIFGAHGYPKLMLAFLRSIVRDPAVNAGCATSGGAIRQVYSGETAPPSVVTIPDDLCASNGGLADAAVETLVDEVCRTDKALVLLVEGPEGSPVEYDLCARHHEAVLLANPQYLSVNGAARVLVVPPQEPTVEQTVVAGELVGLGFPGIGELSEPGWPAVAVKGEADFANAETP